MPNVSTKSLHHNDKLELFTEHCEARAHLWVGGKLTLHEAVDWLHDRSVAWGIDIDLAQRIMADAFEKRRIRL